MTVIDASPLIAVLVPSDVHHGRCVAVLPSLTAPLVTTWPVLVEAMYVLGKYRKWRGQQALWQMITSGTLQLQTPDTATLPARLERLMDTYQHVPMDMADASLVALAEDMGIKRIFTCDKDFAQYRINGTETFDIVP